jgi:hypothetical protein
MPEGSGLFTGDSALDGPFFEHPCISHQEPPVPPWCRDPDAPMLATKFAMAKVNASGSSM